LKLSNSKILNFVLFLAIIALVGGGVLAWQAGWFKEVSDDGGAAPQSGAAQEQAQAEQKKLAQAAGELSVAPLSETYEDPDFGFSLNYPSALALTQIPADPESGAAETIIFEQAGAGLGFQIAVSPFTEENADITPERIKADIPDMVMPSRLSPKKTPTSRRSASRPIFPIWLSLIPRTLTSARLAKARHFLTATPKRPAPTAKSGLPATAIFSR